MLASPCHIIATMRAKTEYVVSKDDRGKTKIEKVGLAPVQRDTMEYEFDVTATLDQDHKLVVTKTRCFPLADKVIVKPGEEIGKALVEWLDAGAPEVQKDTPAPDFKQPTPAPDASPAAPVGDDIATRIVTLQKTLAVQYGVPKAELLQITAALRATVSEGKATRLNELTELQCDELAAGLTQWAMDWNPEPAQDDPFGDESEYAKGDNE